MSKGYMYDESKKMVWDDSKRDYLTSYEAYLLLNEKDAELNRYAELFGMKDKDFYVVEKEEYDKMVSGAKQFANETAIKSLNKVHKFFSKTFVGVGLNTYCERVRPVESFIIEEIKKLKGGE